jgi:hypothetical protein
MSGNLEVEMALRRVRMWEGEMGEGWAALRDDLLVLKSVWEWGKE